VDPIIGNPLSSQSLNPYSYIGNNPLSGADPTGYADCLTTDAPSCAKDAVNTVTNPDSGQKTNLLVGDKGTHFQLTDSVTNKSRDFTVGGNGAQKIDFSSILAKNTSPDQIQSLSSKDLGPAKSAAMMSQCTYGSCTLPSNVRPIDLGFNEQHHINPGQYDDPGAQFHAEGFVSEDGSDAYLAFRGTRPTNLQDWVTNVDQGAGLKSQAYDDAARLGAAFAKNVGDATMTYTGHSLGGGEASLAGLVAGVHTYTFNSAGLSSGTLSHYGVTRGMAAGLVDAYYLRGEVLSGLQDHSPLPRAVGTRHPIEPVSSTPWNPVAKHSMDSVLDAMNGGH
jgi:hypothetical protein